MILIIQQVLRRLTMTMLMMTLCGSHNRKKRKKKSCLDLCVERGQKKKSKTGWKEPLCSSLLHTDLANRFPTLMICRTAPSALAAVSPKIPVRNSQHTKPLTLSATCVCVCAVAIVYGRIGIHQCQAPVRDVHHIEHQSHLALPQNPQ